MKDEYDLSKVKSGKNPYAKRPKKTNYNKIGYGDN